MLAGSVFGGPTLFTRHHTSKSKVEKKKEGALDGHKTGMFGRKPDPAKDGECS